MGLYRDHVLPHLINLAMRKPDLAAYRKRVVPAAEGRVLEIGIGSGLNLPFYGSAAREVIGLDPSASLLGMTRRAMGRSERAVELLEASAEAIPLEAACVDTVVTTWTLCSVPEVDRALRDIRRILRPGGCLLFVEHGRAPEASVRRWQDRLTPLWRRIGGGCHLNRPIRDLIENAGFRIDRLDTGYMRGPRPMTFMYEGSAQPR